MIIAGLLNLFIVRGCTFEELELQMQDTNGNPVVITNFLVSAQVRTFPGDVLVVDLAPTVTDGANGTVTIPEISDSKNLGLSLGNHRWDLLLEDTGGVKVQMLSGDFTITDPITND
jgi:hypothetical protein